MTNKKWSEKTPEEKNSVKLTVSILINVVMFAYLIFHHKEVVLSLDEVFSKLD